ncbi:MAG: hypothetical protein AMXMBFR47_42660 [Planctomycetota bacterium]
MQAGFRTAAAVAMSSAMGLGFGCIGSSSPTSSDGAPLSNQREFPVASLPASSVTVAGADAAAKAAFRVWLADDEDTRAEGLMYLSADEIPDDQGMLFVFDDERIRGFWMKNTITSLDIAFARADGTIVATHTMPPLTLQTYSSIEPAMFALEVKAGTFQRLAIAEGDRIVIPDDVFKRRP